MQVKYLLPNVKTTVYVNIEYSQWRNPMNLMNIGKNSQKPVLRVTQENIHSRPNPHPHPKVLYINKFGNFSLGMENSRNIRKLIPMRKPINVNECEVLLPEAHLMIHEHTHSKDKTQRMRNLTLRMETSQDNQKLLPERRPMNVKNVRNFLPICHLSVDI